MQSHPQRAGAGAFEAFAPQSLWQVVPRAGGLGGDSADPGEDEEAAALERERGPGEPEPSPRREEPRSSFTHFRRLTQALPYQFSRPGPRAPSKTDPTRRPGPTPWP